MFQRFIKLGDLDLSKPLDENYKNTTIDKIQYYLNGHWSKYNPNEYINICDKNDVVFDVERFINSWQTIQPGDYIEQQARKLYIYRIQINKLFDFALYALNNKCLTVTFNDIEILLYILYAHHKYNLSFTDKTTQLIINILTNKYFIDYQLIFCYMLLKLLPTEIIYNIHSHIIDNLASSEVINRFKNEPFTFNIFYQLIGILRTPHNINTVIIKNVFKRSLYYYLLLFEILPRATTTALKRFCCHHYEKVNNNNYIWYLLCRFEEKQTNK